MRRNVECHHAMRSGRPPEVSSGSRRVKRMQRPKRSVGQADRISLEALEQCSLVAMRAGNGRIETKPRPRVISAEPRPAGFGWCFAAAYCECADPRDLQPITCPDDSPQHRRAEPDDSVIDEIDDPKFQYGRFVGLKHGYAVLGSDESWMRHGERQSIRAIEIHLNVRPGRRTTQRNQQFVRHVAVHAEARGDIQIVSIDREPIVEVHRLVWQDVTEIDTLNGHGCGRRVESAQHIAAPPAGRVRQTADRMSTRLPVVSALPLSNVGSATRQLGS